MSPTIFALEGRLGLSNLKHTLTIASVTLNLLALWLLLRIRLSEYATDRAGWVNTFSSRSTAWLLATATGLALITPIAVKFKIINHESQVKFLGVEPGNVKITFLGYHKSICYGNIAFSVSGPTDWVSAQVELVGRDVGGTELYRTEVKANLSTYDFIKISPPSNLCEKVSNFTVERFSNFKAKDLTDAEVKSRERLLTYSLDTEYMKDVRLGSALNVAKAIP
jgi:hypothetical protein